MDCSNNPPIYCVSPLSCQSRDRFIIVVVQVYRSRRPISTIQILKKFGISVRHGCVLFLNRLVINYFPALLAIFRTKITLKASKPSIRFDNIYIYICKYYSMIRQKTRNNLVTASLIIFSGDENSLQLQFLSLIGIVIFFFEIS